MINLEAVNLYSRFFKKQKSIFSGSKSAVWTGKTMQESKFQLKILNVVLKIIRQHYFSKYKPTQYTL